MIITPTHVGGQNPAYYWSGKARHLHRGGVLLMIWAVYNGLAIIQLLCVNVANYFLA